MSQVSDESAVATWGARDVADLSVSSGPSSLVNAPVRTSKQSGLPLAWSALGPMSPKETTGRTISLVVKRGIDIVLSLIALVFLSPLLIAVAIAIKLSSEGPVLFSQDRVGLGGRLFRTYKFRSMYVSSGDPTGRNQTRKGDQRITRVGRFIRKSSIDELPQLLNVLRGDMSIIGPRPHVPGMLAAGIEYEELVPYYEMRYLMRPGLSGWAQANGFRGPTDEAISARARINHDIAYIQNFSIALDIWIILMTLKSEFFTGSGV